MTRCRFALICEEAVERDDGSIDIRGAGLDRLAIRLPARGKITLVFRIEFAEAEAQSLSTLRIAFRDPLGREISFQPGRFFPDWDGSKTATMIVPYPIEVTSPGRHSFALDVGGEVIATLPLDVEDE